MLAVVFVFISVFFVGVLWASSHDVVTEEVRYHKKVKEVRGFLARPADNKKYPGVVLIHEWTGLKLGYVALAVDLYQGQVATNRDEAGRLAGWVRENREVALENLKQAVAYLKGRSTNVDPQRLASVGWCFGGGWSYQMAKNDLGVKATVIYYGHFNPKDDLSRMRTTIIGHFGEKDRSIKVDDVRAFQAKLKTLNGDHEIYIYPNAGHGFVKPGRKRYRKEAAEDAWKRTTAFLKKYL
jgi:carboxymethylenebutenolidase